MNERERQSVHVEETDVQSGFLCDEPEMTRFFREQALRFEKSGFARTYVVRRDADDPADFPLVLGYYTICMARVNTAELPEEIGTLEPNSPSALPAALLGRMARDQRVPRRLQLGEWLVGDALRRIMVVQEEIGCALITLHAMNSKLVNYYHSRFGFVPIKRQQNPQGMVMLLDTLRDGVSAA